MPAYLLAICEITNPNDNFRKYAAESATLLHQHGGEYIVRGAPTAVLHGEELQGKVVIISKFPTMEALQGFVNDPTYVRDVAPLREGTGIYNFACYESPPAEAS